IAGGARGTAPGVVTAGNMRLALDRHKTDDVVGPSLRFRGCTQLHDHVLGDSLGAVGSSQRSLFDHIIDAVVADAAYVAAAGGHDPIEQDKLGITAVHGIEAIRLDSAFEHGPLIAIAAAVARDIHS